jgi:hypothetical protein
MPRVRLQNGCTEIVTRNLLFKYKKKVRLKPSISGALKGAPKFRISYLISVQLKEWILVCISAGAEIQTETILFQSG